ncbi:unnamed protein product [Ilex paraguariensis]|uniref:Protein root UVB sensitive/RUS domain-containing protein n=1 Tax=Ilex paraguariensis TaxID=185542 RepID=A0ABC8UIJ3_9AQUA
MSYTLQLSVPNLGFESSRKVRRQRFKRIQILCTSSDSARHSNSDGREAEEDSEHRREEGQPREILVERYGNGTSKRYVLDEDLLLRTFLEKRDSKDNGFQGSHISPLELSWLPDAIKDFVLPAGYPGSVSDDYLEYMLLQFPTNVTGWICHALVTSSLLKACQSNSGC